MKQTIHIQVVVDLNDLRKWADWHVDHNHHGVAAVLYDAIERLKSGQTVDGICTADPCILPPGHDGECRR